MRRMVGKNKKGKKVIINIPTWDDFPVVNPAAYDVSITSTSGSLSN